MQHSRSKKLVAQSVVPLSHRQVSKRRTSDPKDLAHTHTKSCRFCCKAAQPLYCVKNKLWAIGEGQTSLNKILNHSLPMKYSQSQTYYYTKPINEFLHGQRNTSVIKLKELISFSGVEGDEWMRRTYQRHEITNKIHLLTEYYRFHNEIPRMFMIPECDIMNNYHDKKRRIEYFRIAKEIEDENRKNPDKPPKGIVGDKPDVKRESQDQSQFSNEDQQKYYGNLLQDITLESKKNQSLTMQEINQRLEEAAPNRNLVELTKQFERDLQQQPLRDEETLKQFISYTQHHTKKSKRDLNLNEDLIERTQKPRYLQETVKPEFIYMYHLFLIKETIKSPQSARNTPQTTASNLITGPKTTLHKSKNGSNQQFFMSEALQARLNLQQQKSQFSISPRSATKQPLLQQLQQHQQPSQQQQYKTPTLTLKGQPKQLQGFQGSQEAYQISGQEIQPTQIMSAKNYTQVKSFFPSTNSTKHVNQSNSSKINSKISALVTAESSPTHKPKPLVVGSQTHRVTSQKDIQNLLRLQQLRQQEGMSKETLSKLLSPMNPAKQITDFFLMQIQAMKSSQSNSSQNLRVQQPKGVIVNQLVRRNTKNAKLRNSLNVADPKSPHQTQVLHQHTRSDVQQIGQDMQKQDLLKRKL